MTNQNECDHIIGQSIIKPGLSGLLYSESERFLYEINYDEYVRFIFCPSCGVKIDEWRTMRSSNN